MATIIWAWLQGWFSSFWAPLTIPVALVVVVLTMYLVKQFKIERKVKRLTEYSNKDIDDTVRGWINIPSWRVEKGNLPSGLLLQYELTTKADNFLVHIERRQEEPEVVALHQRFF